MTTPEAFAKILAIKKIESKLNISQPYFRLLKTRAKRDKLSVEKMEALLILYGATKKSEHWTL